MKEIIQRLPNGDIRAAIQDEPWSEKFGAKCIGNNTWERVFKYRPISLPDELNEFKETNSINCSNRLWITMNGFSNTEEFLQKYQLKPNTYEMACTRLFMSTINGLRCRFPNIDISVLSGASNTGIDLALAQACAKSKPPIVPVGVTCPRFLLYIQDDPQLGPVYVASTKEEYAGLYVEWADLLITTGGREHALVHDIYCACKSLTKIYFVNVLKLICSNLSQSGILVNPATGKVTIENAPAVFGNIVSFFEMNPVIRFSDTNLDIWKQCEVAVTNFAIEVARQKLPPEIVF